MTQSANQQTNQQTSQQVVPEGFVLVPKRVSADMRQAMDADGWHWEDLLAAACVITEEVYAEIAAQPAHAERAALNPWRSIESAPKDEWVMLLMPEVKHPWHGPRIVFAHWFTPEDGASEWCWPEDEQDLYTVRGRLHAMQQLENGDLYCSSAPTHWMPLPALPSGEAIYITAKT